MFLIGLIKGAILFGWSTPSDSAFPAGPSRAQALQIGPEADSQSGQIRGAQRGGLRDLGAHHGHLQQVSLNRFAIDHDAVFVDFDFVGLAGLDRNSVVAATGIYP